MFEVITVNINCRKLYNKELLQMFGDLVMLSFVSISQLNWLAHIKRLDT
jgi:hypothetical protein